ncbi:MAG: hypothetical protein WBB19_18635 [Desulforhopalus sp.]
MFEITDVIVGFWFLPVTLFIIFPLLMLCGWTVIKIFKQLMVRPSSQKQKDPLEDTKIQAERS